MSSNGGYPQTYAVPTGTGRRGSGDFQETLRRIRSRPRARLVPRKLPPVGALKMLPRMNPYVGVIITAWEIYQLQQAMADRSYVAVNTSNYTFTPLGCSSGGGPMGIRNATPSNCTVNGVAAIVPKASVGSFFTRPPPNDVSFASFAWQSWNLLQDRYVPIGVYNRIVSRPGFNPVNQVYPDPVVQTPTTLPPGLDPMPTPDVVVGDPVTTPATWPKTGDEGWPEGSQSGPDPAGETSVNPGYRWEPPRKGEDERKVKPYSPFLVRLLQKAGHATTEGLDLLEAIWKAIPKELRTKPDYKSRFPKVSPQQMAWDIATHFHDIDLNQALLNILTNHVSDEVVGRARGQVKKWATDKGIVLGLQV